MRQTSSLRRSQAASMASFLVFLAFFVARGQAFQAPQRPSINQPINLPESTRLSARSSRRKSQTAAFYSSTSDPPLSDKATAKSFGNRMRKLVLRQQKGERTKQSKRSGINPSKPSFVEEAVSLSTYKEMVAGNKQERLVVVRFYAKWCRACKAVEPYFYRLAHSMPDVKFVEVPVMEENANLHQGLGVPALPYAHIYSPTAGLVEELRMAKNEFKNFQKVVETYRDGQCSNLELDPETGMFSSPFSSKEDKEHSS